MRQPARSLFAGLAVCHGDFTSFWSVYHIDQGVVCIGRRREEPETSSENDTCPTPYNVYFMVVLCISLRRALVLPGNFDLSVWALLRIGHGACECCGRRRALTMSWTILSLTTCECCGRCRALTTCECCGRCFALTMICVVNYCNCDHDLCRIGHDLCREPRGASRRPLRGWPWQVPNVFGDCGRCQALTMMRGRRR